MKTKAILLALAVTSLSVFGQGQILFSTPSASATYRIFLNDGTIATPLNRVQMGTTAGAFTFYAVYGATGGPLSSTTGNLFNSSFTTGKINETAAGVSPIVNIGLSTPIDLQVFGFSTAAGSYANALATPGYYAGVSRLAVGLTPSTSPTPGQSVFASGATGIIGFDLVLTQVPEPSTMVLAGLGIASLAFFRRRKA